MPKLYHIKPKGDGYHILGHTLTGEYYLVNKETMETGWRGQLIFNTIEEAQEYIDKHNLTDNYIPEEYWRSDRTYNLSPISKKTREILNKANIIIKKPLICPDCGYDLKYINTIGADETQTNFTESLYHCEKCLRDYSIVKDADNCFVKMTRHF